MAGARRPFEFDEVFAKVRERDPRVTRATVQRALRTFSEAGVVEEGDGGYQLSAPEPGEGARYDHLVCTKCGTILDFDDQELAVLRRAVAAHHGFVVKHY